MIDRLLLNQWLFTPVFIAKKTNLTCKKASNRLKIHFLAN